MERLIRILIVEDQRVVGQGLAELLGGQDGLVIVGREETIGRAVDVLSVCKPDVVLSDVMFGTEPDGLELARRVRAMRGPGRVSELVWGAMVVRHGCRRGRIRIRPQDDRDPSADGSDPSGSRRAVRLSDQRDQCRDRLTTSSVTA